MKISYNWLQDYIKTDMDVHSISSILTDIGLEVEGVDHIQSIEGGLEGIIVGEVLEKSKHPGADRLSLTKVDLGNGEPVQIVCGAPNVEAGQKVLVATVGATLYPLKGDSFKIKKGKIRGEVSMGMICAEDEIGLGESHDGIMVLDSSAKVGSPAIEVIDAEDDYIIEIGLTPNRADAFSHIGVARDLAVALSHMKGIANHKTAVTWPDVSNFKVDNSKLTIPVEVLDKEACPRYMGLSISGVVVSESPEWLLNKLKSIGLTPINNIVDITNFVLHEVGQPLHAFDADGIEGGKVIVRKLSEGAEFTTLDEVERKLSSEDLMICNEKGGMCIAGVFGGIKSGVTEKTKNIFLESAYFDSVSIRKTARRHGLNTDASFRFERGVDPNITEYALKRAAMLICDLAGGTISSEIIDSNPTPTLPFEVPFNLKRCGDLIGMEIPEDVIRGILKDLEIEIKSESGSDLILLVPPYRVDVLREADVIEDILRIYGYNNVPMPEKLNASLSYAPNPNQEKIRNRVSDLLCSRGFTEMMSNSLTKEKHSEFLPDHVLQSKSQINILNPLSQDLGVLRQTLIHGGLEAIAYNINHKQSDLRLFEYGSHYNRFDGKYFEDPVYALFLTGKKNPENWNSKSEDFNFADLLAEVEAILSSLRLRSSLKFADLNNSIYSDGVSFKIGKSTIAEIGIVRKDLCKAFDIKQQVLAAEINWGAVMTLLEKEHIAYQEPAKFPAVRRDLSLLLDSAISFAELRNKAFEVERKLLLDVGLFDVYEGDKIAAGKKSYALSFILQDTEKTLNDKLIEKSMSKIQTAFENSFGATLR